MKISSYYDHHQVPPIEFKGKSLAQQQFKDESNVNHILKKYGENRIRGNLALIGNRSPMYGDFSNLGTYADALQMSINAQQMFEQLPARIRDKFENKPANLISWIENPENKLEAQKLGIMPKDVTEPNKEVPVGTVPQAPVAPPVRPMPGNPA